MNKSRNTSAVVEMASPSDTLRSQSSVNSSSSRNPRGASRLTPDRKPSQQQRFHEMQAIDENAISIAPSPDYGYAGGGDDSENLRLFPKRHPEWLITSNFQTPVASRSPRDLYRSTSGDSKPLLINNGNISSDSGRNGATLNRISNANGSGSGNPRAGNGSSSNGKIHVQCHRRRRRGFRMESFQVELSC